MNKEHQNRLIIFQEKQFYLVKFNHLKNLISISHWNRRGLAAFCTRLSGSVSELNKNCIGTKFNVMCKY